MNLKSYFENAVSAENADRTLEILKSRINRQSGQRIYSTKVVDVVEKAGEGKTYGIFLMFADGKHALRFNWKTSDTSAAIMGIDFWIHMSKTPQFSVNTENMNIVDIVNLIDDMVNGIEGDEESTIEEGVLFTEAAGGKSFKDVKAYFAKKGYMLEKDPAFTVRRYIATERSSGEQTAFRYIPVMSKMYEEVSEKGVASFLAEYNADGGNGGGSAKVRSAAKEIPVPREPSPFDALFEDPLSEKELFGLLDRGIDDVKSGKSKTLIVSGDAGIGKTFTVTQRLAGSNSEAFKGGITSAAALYKMLFLNNQKGKILIFDDLDSLLENDACVNILKGALDSSDKPEVSYTSNNTIHPTYYKALTGEYDIEDPKVIYSLNLLKIDIENMEEKRLNNMRMRVADPYSMAAILPNKFYFIGRVIFITNKYLDQLPGAIISRGGAKVEVNLTLEEIVKRIENLLDKIEVPVEPGTPPISMADKQKAMDYCKTVLIPYGKIKKIDFRSFFDICRLASGDAPKELWWKWASVMMMESYGDRDTSIKRKKR